MSLASLTLETANAAATSEAGGGPITVLLLAVLQGLAEFLPISSSGHLVLGRAAMGLKEGGLALDVALHVGTLVAVMLAYRQDVVRLFQDLLARRFQMWIWLIVATIPAAVIGLTFKDLVEEASTQVIVACIGLCVTAVLLWIGESKRPKEEAEAIAKSNAEHWGDLRLSHALFMGFAQALAIVPGISRSGSTISTAFLRGIPAVQAARLSFLMSLPAIAGAAILELPDLFEQGVGDLGTGWILTAMALSALVGFLALRTLILVLSKGALRYFALYCVSLAAVAFLFLR